MVLTQFKQGLKGGIKGRTPLYKYA
ncbi:hypothetical protein PP583_gp14 [Pseudoalteromonas phage HS6]|nr:hypothetical protein PP583_gp14 [Pseudoalteromonas phage HS6]